jgi:hypothetical protein
MPTKPRDLPPEGSHPSSMPKGEYVQEGGDYDLAAVNERPLDKELQGLVRAFEGWTPAKRAEARSGVSMDEQYTLIHFAKRCSVLALKEKSTARSEDGLLALAMIDETRIAREMVPGPSVCLRTRSTQQAQTGSAL